MQRRTVLAITALAAGGLAFGADSTPSSGPAKAAATAWLKRVDAGDARSSWELAATNFKSAVSIAQWSQALSAARAPLGELLQREEHSAQSAATLPGAPDGHYLVLQFQSSFQNKAKAKETVTVVLEPDGAWRVTGYFIQ